VGAGVVKKRLVGAVQIPLQSGRLRFAEALDLTPVLVKEMEAYRLKVTVVRDETFEAWRERDHDDLVLALALAVYVASFRPSRAWVNGERIQALESTCPTTRASGSATRSPRSSAV